MSISSISNGESGSSVRSTLNSVINVANSVSGVTTASTLDSIVITLDGQGFVLASGGTYGNFVAPWDGVITGWYLMETSSSAITSSITIDVWKAPFASYPPTVANTIWGTKPALSTAKTNSATGLSIAVSRGDVFKWYIDSVSLAKLVQLVLLVTKT